MERLTRRYIDANALQEQLERKKAGIANQRYTEGWNDCMMRVKSMVSKASTADVVPVVHGRWEMRQTGRRTDTGVEYKAYCTACNEPNKQYQPPFCPHCGAIMDGGNEDKNDD